MGFIKEHLWPAVFLVVSGIWTVWGIASQAYELWTAGMSPVIWSCIGALSFMITVAVLLGRFQKNLSKFYGQSRIQSTHQTSQHATPAGAASTRDVFQNEEIRVWDLVPRNSSLIRNKTFVECAFYGPAAVALLQRNSLEGCSLVSDNIDKNLLEVPEDKTLVGIYGIEGCRFQRCVFHSLLFLGTAEHIQYLRKSFPKGN